MPIEYTNFSAVKLDTPLEKANANGSLKKMVINVQLAPITGAAADSTAYSGWAIPGRACTVTKVSLVLDTAPTGPAAPVTVKKGSFAGVTMLTAATFSAVGVTANTVTDLALSAVADDLKLAANQAVHLRYNPAVQTADAINVAVAVEIEFDDI